MEDDFQKPVVLPEEPELTDEMKVILEKQNSRMVSEFKANKLEVHAAKNWDSFYKRNETRFFKDRLWTTREFEELLTSDSEEKATSSERKTMLEVGCGVGNLIFPLVAEKVNYFIHACDFSPRAIEFVKNNELYDPLRMKAFTCDITKPDILNEIPSESLDIITMIFVLSAIHPEKFQTVANTLYSLLKPNGLLLFRDYGWYDMTQLRFKPGNKIADNFYVRQDDTRSYFFSLEETKNMFESAGFEIIQNNFIERRTINKKESVNVQRWFLQGKYRKPMR